ncbi:sulfotransferase [uncultured Maricaulis sp.]|uniref:sulfotransferase n=1 Tax=uncultured Maricaulis sp. TaxID=174710 RepID=UPI00261650C3|nr:sulfotransferase [uncultured Maricaulis sp.]
MSALLPHSGASSALDFGDLAHSPMAAFDRMSQADLRSLSELLKTRPKSDLTPIRTVHHFACTGGTLIARGLQSQPNALLLSEVDPLSTIQLNTQRSRFAPTDPILLARGALSPIDEDTAVEMFCASMKALHARMDRIGRRLILRDHAHSQFCTDTDWERRPTLAAMLADWFPLRSIVTVRHPIDSYLALDRNDWRHFSPFSLEEYARRYLAFLSAYQNVAIIRYERFVSDPDETMREICRHLELAYNPDWKALISVMRLSGDSGRRGDKIAPRSRRDYSDELVVEAEASGAYQDLCLQLGYDAELDRAEHAC